MEVIKLCEIPDALNDLPKYLEDDIVAELFFVVADVMEAQKKSIEQWMISMEAKMSAEKDVAAVETSTESPEAKRDVRLSKRTAGGSVCLARSCRQKPPRKKKKCERW